MSILRLRAVLSDGPLECAWVVLDATSEDTYGHGLLADAPRDADRVELVIAAADVLLARAQLPPNARRRAGDTLAYAVEEETLGDPQAQHVSWLGKRGVTDALAVVDRRALQRWLEAIDRKYDAPCVVYCETLLLPRATGEWSIAWNGSEGCVRTAELEGGATDAGDRLTPPLALKLRIEQCDSKLPDGIAVYVTTPHAEPDLDAWRQTLGVGLYIAGAWDWRKAAAADSAPIAQSSGHTRALSRVAAKLRPAAWIAGAALAIHAFALAGDWALVAGEQHALRRQMETRFRSVFPEAVAVVDPALQMRRKLAETRHSAHRTDEADFAPLIGHAAAALNDSAPGAVRLVTYDRGRLTLHLAPGASALARRTAVRLREAGLIVEMTPVSPNAADHAVALTIGPS